MSKPTWKAVEAAWQNYAAAYLPWAKFVDEHEVQSAWTAGDYIDSASLNAAFQLAYGSYLEALVAKGVISRDEVIDDDNLLWESHPKNLRAELDGDV